MKSSNNKHWTEQCFVLVTRRRKGVGCPVQRQHTAFCWPVVRGCSMSPSAALLSLQAAVLALCCPEPLTETPQGRLKVWGGVQACPCPCHLSQPSSWQVFQAQMWAAQQAVVLEALRLLLCAPLVVLPPWDSDKVALTRGVTWSCSCTGALSCGVSQRGLGEDRMALQELSDSSRALLHGLSIREAFSCSRGGAVLMGR